MSGDVLAALVETGSGGEILLRSPKLGLWSHHPTAGALLGPGGSLGLIAQLDRRYEIRLPDGVSGRVAELQHRDHVVPVDYGALLARLVPVDASKKGPRTAAARPAGRHVVAPTDGVFYGAPGPGAPPFVTKGSRVSTGQTIGLIEVMKTFNPIPYAGAALPEAAEVVEVLVADGEEVRAGQPLLSVK